MSDAEKFKEEAGPLPSSSNSPEWSFRSGPKNADTAPFTVAEMTDSLSRPTAYVTKFFAISDRSCTYNNWLMFATHTAAAAFRPDLSRAIDYPALLGRVLRARIGATTTTSMAGQQTNLHVTEMEAMYDELFYPFGFRSVPEGEKGTFYCRTVLHFPGKRGTMRYLHAQMKIVVLE